MDITPLSPDRLYHRCDLSGEDFRSTADLTAEFSALGQERAMEAIRFAISMGHTGYNLFVSGSTGVGRRELVSRTIHAQAAAGEPPQDWLYVHNFERPHEPRHALSAAGAWAGAGRTHAEADRTAAVPDPRDLQER